MKNQDNRQVHLNLLTINLPLTALLSILHRISGFGVFLSFLLTVWLLERSLFSEEEFTRLINDLENLLVLKIFLSLILLGFIFHFFVGLKKIVSELFNIGENLESARLFSLFTLIIFFLLGTLMLIYFW